MDGSLVWSNQHHQSGTLMPSGAVHPIFASHPVGAKCRRMTGSAKQSRAEERLPALPWIASSLRASQ
jgi:hypothetical protein